MKLGADPELFLMNKNHKHISVCGKLNADKWNPISIPGLPNGFAMLEDNVAVEYNIPPASSADEFVAHIQQAQAKLLEQFKGLSFSNLSCVVFSKDQVKHPGAKIFGCEPDFDAWTGKENSKPKPPVPTMRSAGGHIHVETDLDKRLVIQAMDLYLGVPSILMDTGEERRQLYGKAGCFRPKSYGVEYRTLSNFWVFKEKYIRWVWKQTEKALAFTQTTAKILLPEIQEKIHKAINNGDKTTAAHLVVDFNLEVV